MFYVFTRGLERVENLTYRFFFFFFSIFEWVMLNGGMAKFVMAANLYSSRWRCEM